MIKFENVSYSYRVSDAEGNQLKKVAIQNMNIKIGKGEFVVLTGNSGCGKTTICRLINGLIPHYFEGELQGKVLLGDTVIADLPIYETAKTVGSVFQNPRSQFFNVDTTSELAFAAENQGRNPEQIKRAIMEVSNTLGLSDLLDRSIFELSGGEKQRIACGSVAVADTDIVVLDEPSANLDMNGIENLRRILAIWKEMGKTIVISEHRLYFLRELADRVLIIEDGQIKKEFCSEEFKSLSAEGCASLGIRPTILPALPEKYECEGIEMSETILLEGIRYLYADKTHGIHIARLILPKNKVIAIIGHNGAGKSTFARTLCGLNKKAKGTVCINGKKIPVDKMLGNCYMIMQDVNHQLFTESVLEEVMISIPEKYGEDKREIKAREALRLLEMEHMADAHPMSLSGGQKQRVAIASGLVTDKEIILLDEPTSGLDYHNMQNVAQALQKIKDQGRTVLVITHDNELIDACADMVVRLERGELAN